MGSPGVISLRKKFALILVTLLVQACAGATGTELLASQVPDPQSAVFTGEEAITVDFIPLENYITNPGIGWQRRPEESEHSQFPEMVAYGDRRETAWSILNPEEGVYRWAPLDTQLRIAASQGKQFSFRVYTMVGEEFGGHMLPEWVIKKGAIILESGEPDYSNCTYLEEWGRFVEQLARRYDGNPDIAFIDISGYGNFNEWSWRDGQTEWDETWQERYRLETATPDDFHTLDGQARRRLVDMFIGGKYERHDCRTSTGEIRQSSYSYSGFQSTQLVMPYAGIVQSAQYVFSRRPDVGFRYDCLGRDGDKILDLLEGEFPDMWEEAPIVFELCPPDEVDLEEVRKTIPAAHASIVHDNEWAFSREQLTDIMIRVGYRYFLKQASISFENRTLHIYMEWQNLGYAPGYPQMGQTFQLHLFLLDRAGKVVLKIPSDTNVSAWLPASGLGEAEAPVHAVEKAISIPPSLPRGEYLLGVGMLDTRTSTLIHLAINSQEMDGIYILSDVLIQ